MNEANDANEENEVSDAKIAVFTAMATIWINEETLNLCLVNKAPSEVCFSVILTGALESLGSPIRSLTTDFDSQRAAWEC
jgi:hypothetical protein